MGGAGRKRLLEFQLAGLQLDDLGAEGPDALAALGFGQGAGLEGAQVAFDRGFGLVDFGADRGQLTLGAVADVGGLAADGAGCLLGEVGAGEGVQQGRQDGLVELVGG